MAKLIYSALTSLDGYVADERGHFEWAAPDREVHEFVNDAERPIGTYLYGRRMYETMVFWETAAFPEDDADPLLDPAREYADLWRAADKVVYSRSLTSVSSDRTRIEAEFDPAAVRALKGASPHDVSIGGAELAGQALAAGLVDECHLYLNPVVVGGGTRALPDGVRADLDLVDQHCFDSGTVHLRYRVRT